MTPEKPGQAMAAPRRPLGQTLLARGILTQDQLRIALMEQKARSVPLGRTLVQLGFLSEATLREVLAENLGHHHIDLTRLVPSPAAVRLVPRDFARRHAVFPVSVDETRRTLRIACANPNNVVTIDQLNAQLKGRYRLELAIAAEGEIANAIDLHYGYELSIDGILNEIETGEIDYQSLAADFDEYSQPVVRLVGRDAQRRGQARASDIHFEPEQGFLRIRYRIDGVLRQIRALHTSYWPAMSVRLKIDERHEHRRDARAAGRPHLADALRPPDRLPCRRRCRRSHGENFVLRILDRESGIVPLERPGPAADEIEAAQADARAPRRHHAGHRPDRQRQDHDALLDPLAHQRPSASTS